MVDDQGNQEATREQALRAKLREQSSFFLRAMDRSNPLPDMDDAVQVAAQLLACLSLVEQIVCHAAGAKDHLPSFDTNVRAHVERVLGGDARVASREQLEKYLAALLTHLQHQAESVEGALVSHATRIATRLDPARVESEVVPSALLRAFRLHEGVYWRAFKGRFDRLTAESVLRLGRP